MAYNSLTLVPAYGRDYKSKATLMEDWEAGKDFMAVHMRSSGYTSVRDVPAFKEDGYTHLHFRYAKQSKIHVVKL